MTASRRGPSKRAARPTCTKGSRSSCVPCRRRRGRWESAFPCPISWRARARPTRRKGRRSTRCSPITCGPRSPPSIRKSPAKRHSRASPASASNSSRKRPKTASATTCVSGSPRSVHLIPVRQEVSIDSDNGPVLAGESHVDEWLEVQPNVWTPQADHLRDLRAGRGQDSQREPPRNDPRRKGQPRRPNYPPEFFRDVKFPPELARVHDQGRTPGGNVPQVRGRPPTPRARLKQIVERLREEEARYNRLSVNAIELRTTNPLFDGINKTRTTKMHSLLVDEPGVYRCPARNVALQRVVPPHALDRRHSTARPTALTAAIPLSSRKGAMPGSARGIFSRRPARWSPSCSARTRLSFRVGSSYRRLADILWPAPGTLPPQLLKSVEYLGEAQSGPFECFVLAARPARARRAGVKSLLWLAKDRNLIPVRFEEYVGRREPSRAAGDRGQVSRTVARRVVSCAQNEVHFSAKHSARGARGIFIRRPVLGLLACSRSRSNRKRLPGIFSQIVVDEGIDVQYFDKSGKFIGKFVQTSDSVPEMPAGK